MRISVVGIVSIAVALTLAACGAFSTAAKSFFAPCLGINFAGDPVWSPDGQHIAFIATYPRQPIALYVMNPDGSDIRQLTNSPMTSYGFQWLADSQSIAFTDYHDIVTVTLDGSVSKTILPTAIAQGFRYSPDGMTIAYNSVSDAGFGSIINLINRDGSGYRELINDYEDRLQDWSPDGTRLAYFHNTLIKNPSTQGLETRVFVFTIRADGSQKRKLAEGTGLIKWSPDGQWLVYLSGGDLPGYHVIKADGSGDRLIWEGSLATTILGWLPDSRRIALSDPPDTRLIAIDIGTLATTTLAARDYASSPSGWKRGFEQAVFVSDTQSNSYYYADDIYLINADGTGQTRLTDNPAKYPCFNWPF